MALCFLLGGLILAMAGLGALCLADGGVRRAVHLSFARRFGAMFSPRVIVAGDSLAAGCPWSKLDRRPFAVLNLAEGGATIRQIAGQILQGRPFSRAALIIDGGLNDLLLDRASVEQLEADYRSLLRRVGAHRQVIVTLMPFTADPDCSATIEAANVILSDLCREYGFDVLDINETVSQNRVRKPGMTNDGLHFTRAAEMAWIEAVRRRLEGAP